MAFILIVESDENISRRAADALTAAGHACGCAADGDEARSLLRWRTPELIVIDSDLTAAWAEPLLAELEPREHAIPVLTLSAVAGAGDGIGKLTHGVQDCIRKPFEPRFLVWRVEHALEVHAARTRKAAMGGETASVRSLRREHVPLRSIG